MARRQRNTLIRTTETVRTDQTRSGLKTSVVENIELESQGGEVVSRALVPFVRPRTISFEGRAFLPNTRVYPFFAGVDVSSFCTPGDFSFRSVGPNGSRVDTTAQVDDETFSNTTSPVEGSPLITNGVGEIRGIFRIPSTTNSGEENNPKFSTGEIEFRLTSSSTNSKDEPAVETAGQTIYNAQGTLNTEQETFIATRNGKIVQETVTQNRSLTSSTTRERCLKGRGTDPLAQTFLVTEEVGCFLTKVDLYFGGKDKNLPVWVEIREVVNGYPGPKVLPFGRKVLNASDVNISTDGTTPTTFNFDSPIYLKQGLEYCVVCLTNSLDYRLWISQMGEVDRSGTGRTVSSQPHLGSLFKSQNNTTWNAVQTQDMKLNLYKAKFSTDAGTVTLKNEEIGEEITTEDGTTKMYGTRLGANPIVLSNGNTEARVKHGDHGMYSTSNNVTITGVSSGISTTLDGAITATSTSLTLTSSSGFPGSGTAFVKINNEIISGTISGTTISSLTRGAGSTTAASHVDDSTVELYMINSVPLTEINTTHTDISNINIDSYTITLSTSPSVSGGSTDAEVGGANVYATENYRFETGKTIIESVELPDTSITLNLKKTTGTSPAGTETSFIKDSTSSVITLNENFKLDSTAIVCSRINELNELGGASSLEFPIELSTTNENLSPVIDLDRASFIAVSNRINDIETSSDVYPTANFVASTEPRGDNNSAIYLTKSVVLENPATALKVFFAAQKHSSADIKIMYRIKPQNSDEDFEDLGFVYFNTDGSPDGGITNSLDDNDFREYFYTAGVDDDGNGTALEEFKQFQIKIILQSTDAANPPRIRDLRAIALAT
tara:strand:+ start:4635 stop:7145 length:2511 start_codon:yes stop_codon:yes gene_type:complete